MLKQTKDLMLKIKQLKTENKALTLENHELKQQIKIIKHTIEEQITKAITNATTPLKQQIQQLQTQQHHINQLQEQEILRLKTQINKNSTNSSKPPSTNNSFKKIIHNNREKTGRQTGAQKRAQRNHPNNTQKPRPTSKRRQSQKTYSRPNKRSANLHLQMDHRHRNNHNLHRTPSPST
jgi:hypothetical protein